MDIIYIYDDNGYYQGEIEKQAGIDYNNYLEESPDFETNSPERYLAKVNLKAKLKIWEYEVKPEVLQKEKEEQEKLEAEKRQKENKEQLAIEQASKNQKQSLVFEGNSDILNKLVL